MVQAGENRGTPDVANADDLSFVHIGEDGLPGNNKAYVVTGTGAALLALASDPNFLLGQQITWDEEGNFANWEDSRTAIAPGVLSQINAYLSDNGHGPLAAQDSIVDLLDIFYPGFSPGRDNVHDRYT
jgi:hypothetical protein